MIDVLDNYRSLVHTIADAARWACALEVTAPKLGNVHPGASFSDLRCADFLLAAEDLAAFEQLDGDTLDVFRVSLDGPMSERLQTIRQAIGQIADECGVEVRRIIFADRLEVLGD